MTDHRDLAEAEDQLKLAKTRQAAAEAAKKAAEAEQATAEAEQATAEAKAATAAAVDGVGRTAAEAEATHQAALAVARQKELAALNAIDSAERQLATADRQSERDNRKADAELRKTVAEADAAAVKSYLPSEAKLAPLEGTVDADEKAGVVGDGVALSLVGSALDSLFEGFQTPSGESRVLVVSDQAFANSDWNFHAVGLQIMQLTLESKVLKIRLDNELSEPVASTDVPEDASLRLLVESLSALPAALPAVSPALAVAGAIPSIVAAAADVAGYFQSNYTITGRDVTVEQSHVTALAAKQLIKKPNIKVAVDGFHRLPATKIMTDYKELVEANSALSSVRLQADKQLVAPAAAEIERLKAKLKTLDADLAKKRADDAADESAVTEAAELSSSASVELKQAELEHGRLVALTAAASHAEANVAAFVAAVTAVPASGGMPPLGVAAMRALFHTDSADPQGGKFTHLLNVTVSSIGSESQTRKRRFMAPRIRYISSCTVSALMADSDGNVVLADSCTITGQLSYRLDDGVAGKIEKVELSTAVRASATSAAHQDAAASASWVHQAPKPATP